VVEVSVLAILFVCARVRRVHARSLAGFAASFQRSDGVCFSGELFSQSCIFGCVSILIFRMGFRIYNICEEDENAKHAAQA
jgi:hypothetical protein